jgi:hypothetical protein
MQSVLITTDVVNSNSTQAIQHYVIQFVSDLRQVGGFIRVLQFPPPIKLTATIYLKYKVGLNTINQPTIHNNVSFFFSFSILYSYNTAVVEATRTEICVHNMYRNVTDSCWVVCFWKIRRKTIRVLGPDVHYSRTNSALAWTLNMLYLFCKNKNPFSCIFVYIYVGRNNTENITKLVISYISYEDYLLFGFNIFMYNSERNWQFIEKPWCLF